MPLLDHPVVRTLAGDGQAVELARQADGEVANVDHLLDLAEPFREDLASLQRDQAREWLFGGAQLFAQQPHQFATPRRGNETPLEEGVVGVGAGRFDVGSTGRGDGADDLAVDRGTAFQRSGCGYAQSQKDLAGFFGRAHAASFRALASAATPASMVSSFLAKQMRTMCRGGSRSAKGESGTTATPAC